MEANDPPWLGGSNFSQGILIKRLKEARKKKYNKLSDFSYDLFISQTEKSISKIKEIKQTTNPNECLKIATKVFIYMKLRKDYCVQFYSILENLISDDLNVIITCSYVSSKLMKIVSHGFYKKIISNLKNSHENFTLKLAYFTYFMVKKSFHIVILSMNDFIDLINKIIYNSDKQSKLVAFNTLNETIKIVSKSSDSNLQKIIDKLFYKIKDKLTSNSPSDKFSSTLVLGAIFQSIPLHLVSQTADFFNFFISSLSSEELHSFSMYDIVILSRYHKEYFLKTHFQSIFDILHNDSCSSQTFLNSFCFYIFYTTFSEQIISNESKFIEILENLAKSKETVNNGYRIILDVSKNYSFFIQRNRNFFMSLFQTSLSFLGEICNEYIELMSLFPDLFDLNLLCEEILDQIKNDSSHFFHFLSLCPPLENDRIQNSLFGMLSTSSPELRGQVSAALLNQMSYDDRDFVRRTFHLLFTLALSDRNSEVRTDILNSFNERCYKYLTLPEHIDLLVKFAHDESENVRNQAIRLLGKISKYDPFDVLVVLRSLLLEYMLAIDVKGMRTAKLKFTASLHQIFVSSREILEIYCPTFCDIALRELPNKTIGKLTFLDLKFFDDISINIMKTICFAAQTDISLIKSHLKQFVNFFIWEIQQDISKEVKLATIETLYTIFKGSGLIDGIDLNNLSFILMKFASKSKSNKIITATLKLVGFIGVTRNKPDPEADASDDDKSVALNDPSYFISCVCTTLFDILQNDRLVSYHINCLKSLSSIFSKNVEIYGEKYFDTFISHVIRQVFSCCSSEYIEVLDQICCNSPLSWVMKYKNEIINLTQEILDKKENVESILDFVPTLCFVFKTGAGSFYQNSIEILYGILERNMMKEDGKCISLKSLNAIISLRLVSDNFVFLNIPRLLLILDKKSVILDVKYRIIEFISYLFQQDDNSINSFTPAILRCLSGHMMNIDSNNNKIFMDKVIQALYSLIIKNGSQFSFFQNIITSIIDSLNCISDTDKNNYHTILNSSPPLSFERFSFIQTQELNIGQNTIRKTHINNDQGNNESNNNNNENLNNDANNNENPINSDEDKLINKCTLRIDEESIIKAVSMTEDDTQSNWKDWYSNLVYTFITNSPSPYISVCSFLCQDLFSSAENVFNPAFLSIWLFLTEKTRLIISSNLTRALLSKTLPKHACASLISLVEFLERNECDIEIPKEVLCQSCEKCQQYSNEFTFAFQWMDNEKDSIKANKKLIRIATYFNQIKMKKGLAKLAKARLDVSNSPEWFELIGEWSTARKIYEEQNDSNNFPKIMKCLKHEQLWNEIIEKIDLFDSIESIETKQSTSKFFLSAFYHCRNYDRIEKILPFCPQDSVKVMTILSLYYNSQGNKEQALEFIEKAFNLLAINSQGFINQNQTIINKLVIKSQQLYEVLEIITNDKNLWEKRIEQCPKTYEFYNKILNIRLNNDPIDNNLKYIIKMLKYALKEEQLYNFNSSLHYLFPDQSKWPAPIALLHTMSVWKSGNRKEAIEKIDSLIKNSVYIPQIESDPKLKSRIYFTYSHWLFVNSSLNSIFHVLKACIDLLEISMRTKVRYYGSYHRWAWGCSLMFKKATNVKQHAISAIHGFLECLKLKKETPFDDLVQMISLFFKIKLDEKSFDEISLRIAALSDSTFLHIVPQLFSQISANEKEQQSLFITQILTRLLPIHYNALLVYLIFDREPNQLITNLYNWFAQTNPVAASEALIIKKGLVLCSSSSLEYWMIDIMKTISSLRKNNWKVAIDTLKKIISTQLQPGESEKEEEFRHKIHNVLTLILSDNKQSLEEETETISSIKRSNSDNDLDKAKPLDLSTEEKLSFNSKDKSLINSDIISQLRKIYSLIKEYISNIQYLSMFNVAPELFLLRNSVLAVPGTYDPNKPSVFIKQFDPMLEIFNSKQRPRFLVIYGNDGSRHKSLLKGHEDLRLDFRLMQFFKLINQYINTSSYRSHQHESQTTIFRYAITPITPKCGLIQYVDGADTIFSIITEYRAKRSMNVFAEQTIECEFATPNIDSLRPVQRLEALKEAAGKTSDDDLKVAMWFKSPSTKYFMRTVVFAQSNAVISIVGYILGIGDRHPSNILIHRDSGKVIHIDFGDCFEAAKKRLIFPELIPFRLTRMIVNAFGPNKIEGDFRITCENTLKLIREHVYEIMSILEIFMQEPLEDPFNSDPKKSVIIRSRKKSDAEISSSSSDELTEQFEAENNEDTHLPDMKESIKRVGEKIVGKDEDLSADFSIDKNLFSSIENHVTFLIRNATDEYNLAYLYHGWTPLW